MYFLMRGSLTWSRITNGILLCCPCNLSLLFLLRCINYFNVIRSDNALRFSFQVLPNEKVSHIF